eukprot:GEMP01047831.1.p1 GENE.GEMP01047831.1~~GEMP01047831.1.p1  ORF type:complete len:132 (+),score=10.03 GEMP01047831.1:63-458(+)
MRFGAFGAFGARFARCRNEQFCPWAKAMNMQFRGISVASMPSLRLIGEVPISGFAEQGRVNAIFAGPAIASADGAFDGISGGIINSEVAALLESIETSLSLWTICSSNTPMGQYKICHYMEAPEKVNCIPG